MYFKYSSSASSWPCVNTGCFISCMSTINSVGHEPWCHTSICPSPDNTGNFHEPENDTALSYNLVGRLARETISSHIVSFFRFLFYCVFYSSFFALYFMAIDIKIKTHISMSYYHGKYHSQLCCEVFTAINTNISFGHNFMLYIFDFFFYIYLLPPPPPVIFISCPCYIYESPFLYLSIALFYIYPLPLLYLCLAPNYIYSLSPQAVIFMHCPLLYL